MWWPPFAIVLKLTPSKTTSVVGSEKGQTVSFAIGYLYKTPLHLALGGEGSDKVKVAWSTSSLERLPSIRFSI